MFVRLRLPAFRLSYYTARRSDQTSGMELAPRRAATALGDFAFDAWVLAGGESKKGEPD